MDKFDKYFASLSDDERAYFIACTDIFHDTPYNIIGRPSDSRQLQNTVIFNLERNISVQDFPFIPPTSNWDCNIVSLPWITRQSMRAAVDFGNIIEYTGTTGVPPFYKAMGGVTCFAAASGLDTFTYNDGNPTVTVDCDNLLYPVVAGQPTLPRFYEILAIGFEVYNVTPDLYLGGSLVRYRMPTQSRRALRNQSNSPGVPTVQDFLDFYCLPPIPANESLATQYPDSVIDSARSGTYQQHTRQDAVSDFYITENIGPYIAPRLLAEVPATANNCWVYSSAANNISSDYPIFRGDFDVSGVYFAGLSPQTTLKIRARYIVSIVPSSVDASLISLAKVSPPSNPKLDMIISSVQNKFPPGVPVTMNAKGDWWKKTVKVLATLAPSIGMALAGQTGSDIGTLVQSGLVKKAAKTQAKKKAQAKPVPKVKAVSK